MVQSSFAQSTSISIITLQSSVTHFESYSMIKQTKYYIIIIITR